MPISPTAMASPARQLPLLNTHSPHVPDQPESGGSGLDINSSDENTLPGDVLDDRTALMREPTNELDSYFHGVPASPLILTRAETSKLDDELEMLRVERLTTRVSKGYSSDAGNKPSRTRSRRSGEPRDEFDVATNPVHEKLNFGPPEHPSTRIARFFKRVHQSSFLVRYFVYIVPVVLILLIPLLIGAIPFSTATVDGVSLLWFMVWLEIVWLTLWLGRIIAKFLPYPVAILASIFTNNDKKWKDLAKELELAAALFLWLLALEISFLPTMTHHDVHGNTDVKPWQDTTNKVILTFFVGSILNLIEKLIIQLIAISFHLRTYEDRIEVNRFQIGSLTKLYAFSKTKMTVEDSVFENPMETPSGARTPKATLKAVQKDAKRAMGKIGDAAGQVAGDFTGRAIVKSSHPHQVVLTLLGTIEGGQVLARRLFRTFVKGENDTLSSEDLKMAFESEDEAEAAFQMFDKDLNGDISMDELESVCVEIGRERKSITASLKDLDSVVSKLDQVFTFIVFVITLLVFLSLISTSTAAVLTSAGSTLLALSWLFSATAQEFLQSVIFVFVKHPFDVGDRVDIYGNTGTTGKGDSYFVKEISLLYTEFKKMEGHVVQAPNSYLNTLFILNMRRTGPLAEAVPVTVKFGTTLEQLDQLRESLLDFVTAEKREYQTKILTELRDVTENHSITLNIVFFYKSNWQNELLRLQRRNKFICALMVAMHELDIEGPRMRLPGQSDAAPFYYQSAHSGPAPSHHPSQYPGPGPDPDHFGPSPTNTRTEDFPRQPSILRTSALGRRRGESSVSMSKRVDFSLGVNKQAISANHMGDVFDDLPARIRIPSASRSSDPANESRSASHGSDAGRPGMRRVTTGPAGAGGLARSSSRASAAAAAAAAGGEVRNRLGSLHSHRNRFFGSRTRDDGFARFSEDMEAGRPGSGAGNNTGTGLSPETAVGMADIPEVDSGANSRQHTFYRGTGDAVGAVGAVGDGELIQQQQQQQQPQPPPPMLLRPGLDGMRVPNNTLVGSEVGVGMPMVGRVQAPAPVGEVGSERGRGNGRAGQVYELGLYPGT